MLLGTSRGTHWEQQQKARITNTLVPTLQHVHMTSLRQLYKTIRDTNLNNLIIHWPQKFSLHLGTSLYNIYNIEELIQQSYSLKQTL